MDSYIVTELMTLLALQQNHTAITRVGQRPAGPGQCQGEILAKLATTMLPRPGHSLDVSGIALLETKVTSVF